MCHSAKSKFALSQRGAAQLDTEYGPRAYFCENRRGWLAVPCEHLDPGRESRIRVLVRESLDNAFEGDAYDGSPIDPEQESISLMDYTDIGYDYLLREVRPHVAEWIRERGIVLLST